MAFAVGHDKRMAMHDLCAGGLWANGFGVGAAGFLGWRCAHGTKADKAQPRYAQHYRKFNQTHHGQSLAAHTRPPKGDTLTAAECNARTIAPECGSEDAPAARPCSGAGGSDRIRLLQFLTQAQTSISGKGVWHEDFTSP